MTTNVEPLYGPYDPEQTNAVTQESINMVPLICTLQQNVARAEDELFQWRKRLDGIVQKRINDLASICTEVNKQFNIPVSYKFTPPYRTVHFVLLDSWEVDNDGMIITKRLDDHSDTRYSSDMPFSLAETLDEAKLRIYQIYKEEADRRASKDLGFKKQQLKDLERVRRQLVRDIGQSEVDKILDPYGEEDWEDEP